MIPWSVKTFLAGLAVAGLPALFVLEAPPHVIVKTIHEPGPIVVKHEVQTVTVKADLPDHCKSAVGSVNEILNANHRVTKIVEQVTGRLSDFNLHIGDYGPVIDMNKYLFVRGGDITAALSNALESKSLLSIQLRLCKQEIASE